MLASNNIKNHARLRVDLMTALLSLIGAATVLLGPARLASAQSSASWTFTGNLNSARANHTATLLQNGKVLVAGGRVNPSGGIVNSAELYDSSTGTWSSTGLSASRFAHTAALLPNGKVLVIGGYDGSHPLNILSSAELYDPATGTWSVTGNLNTPRAGWHTATLLPNGKVLVVGGIVDSDGHTTNSAELYDPATGIWTSTGSLNSPLFSTAMLLPNGKVLVFDWDANAELYDPATGAWSITVHPGPFRYSYSATLLQNGKVLLAGGLEYDCSGSCPSNSAELYDPATGTWTFTGNLNLTGGGDTGMLLPSGKVLVFGGGNSAELYDPATGTWSFTASINTARGGRSTTLLSNGKVLVAGGNVSGGPGTLNSAELYDDGSELLVLPADQVTLKSWAYQGRTYAYVKLSFPDSAYGVADWGVATRSGSDFSADALVERFTGPSVQAVTTTAQIYDLGALAAGNYTFTFKNSSTVVQSLTFTISSVPPPPNPIDDARQFVKQQYRDFLNREADQAGEDFWTDNITKCSDPAQRLPGQTEAQCTLRQRETTSGAFFLSPEFQYTSYFVYRMFQGALGRPPKLSEFTPDAQFVGAGIIVNGQLSGVKINQNKADLTAQFVNCTDAAKYRCAEFKTIYDGLSNQQYVDKLFEKTGVNASGSDRGALVNGLNGGTETRASVLQKVVDGINVISEGNQQFTTTYGQAFYNSELNRAFVQLEYFGYLKRDPDSAGYAFWLSKLNQFGGNFVNAEMALAFLSSPEYRARFGQP